MAVSKREEFDLELVQIAEMGRALAHPARVAILRAIAAKQGCVCGEIVDLLPLAQSTVSQHLKILKEIGLVKGEIEGPRSCYCIDWDVLGKYSATFKRFLETLPANTISQCC